jgi:hypothetical protein
MLADPTLSAVMVAVAEVLPCGTVTEVGEIATAGLLLVRVTVTGPLLAALGSVIVSLAVPAS